jgi:hypothetical protein
LELSTTAGLRIVTAAAKKRRNWGPKKDPVDAAAKAATRSGNAKSPLRRMSKKIFPQSNADNIMPGYPK